MEMYYFFMFYLGIINLKVPVPNGIKRNVKLYIYIYIFVYMYICMCMCHHFLSTGKRNNTWSLLGSGDTHLTGKTIKVNRFSQIYKVNVSN